MPRQPAVPHADLINAIVSAKERVSDDKGVILGPTAEVWQQMATALEHKLTSRYIYQYVKQNRHDIHAHLGIIPPTREYPLDADSTCSSVSMDTNEQVENVVQPEKTFTVIFTPEEWHKIKPIEQVYKRKDRPGTRRREVLPQNQWADMLVEKLWTSHKLPCPYTMTRGQVTCGEDSEFIKIYARCKECGASATGVILCKPVEGESVSLSWRSPDTRSVLHHKTRWLSGPNRRAVGSILKRNCASAYRKELAFLTMDQGDLKPPRLWSSEVLRKAKQESREEDLGIKGIINPVLNLVNLKYSARYAGTIHDIGIDKFFVHYYTAAQMLLFKRHCKASYTKLSVDATGTLVKKIKHTQELKSGYIFLYEGVMSATNKTSQQTLHLPVCQMLSEKHDANSIVYWLNEWRRAGAPVPNEVVVDNSAALKSAVARVFTGTDIKSYINQCFDYCKDGRGALPKCYLRLDVAHYICAASRWAIWADKNKKKIKEFYLRCLGILIDAQTFEEFEYGFKDILVVALSPCERDCAGNILPMEESLSRLAKAMSSKETVLPMNNDVTPESRLPDLGNDLDQGSNISDWVKSIKDSIPIVDYSEGRPNPYHLPEAANEFCRMAREFVLWSNIMVCDFASPFKRATSSPIESEFSDLKCNVLKGETKPLKVDTFLAIHIKAIDGACRIKNNINMGSPKRVDLINPTEDLHNPTEDLDDPIEALHDPTEVLHDPTEVLHDTTENLHDPTENLHDPTENLHDPTEVLHDPTEVLHDPTENLHDPIEDLNEVENWRGLGAKPRKKSKYLSAFPGAEEAVHQTKFKCKKTLSILKNGTGKAVTGADGTAIIVKNTCTFDSLCHLVANAYQAFDCYRNQMTDSQNKFIQTAKFLAIEGASRATYALRAETLAAVLEPAFELNMPSTRRHTLALEYDAYGNAGTLLKKMLAPHMSLQVTCELQTHKASKSLLDPDSKVLTKVGIAGLNRSLQDSWRRCDQCAVEYGGHIFVDVEFLSDVRFPGNRAGRLYDLNQLPMKLILGESTFRLSGVIHYAAHHYVAYCMTSAHQWRKVDDLCPRETNAAGDTKIWPCILMYVKT